MVDEGHEDSQVECDAAIDGERAGRASAAHLQQACSHRERSGRAIKGGEAAAAAKAHGISVGPVQLSRAGAERYAAGEQDSGAGDGDGADLVVVGAEPEGRLIAETYVECSRGAGDATASPEVDPAAVPVAADRPVLGGAERDREAQRRVSG